MEISCVICSDLFTPNSEMVLNQCGHMFHYTCLIQWLERSKTCPQCRCKSTPKSLYRVFFNFANSENITDNICTLQCKLDNANFNILKHETEVKKYRAEADSKTAQNIQLKELVSELEKKIRSHESAINHLKEKLSGYKSKAAEADRLQCEVSSLKAALKDVEKVQTAISGTRAEVTEILRNETNIEALALLSATLKKSLIDKEHKCDVLQHRYKQSQNEVMKYKRACNSLESKNADLRNEFESCKKSWEEEKKYLKQKIESLNSLLEEQKTGTPRTKDNSVHRILTESPAPLPRRRINLMKSENPETTNSPTVAENVLKILDSESPYLNTKTNYSSIFTAGHATNLNPKKNPIFSRLQKTWKDPLSVSQSRPSTTETVYTGLGGQVKEDFLKFPSPSKKSSPTGLKRTKSSSAVPSSKFRKLAPLATRKITDFAK